MSSLNPLIDALKKSEADELRLVTGERIHVLRRGKRHEIGREPVLMTAIHQLAVELLGVDGAIVAQEVATSRPVTKDGDDYEVTVAPSSNGLTIVVRAERPPPSSTVPSSMPDVLPTPNPPLLSREPPPMREPLAAVRALPRSPSMRSPNVPSAAPPSSPDVPPSLLPAGVLGSTAAPVSFDDLLRDMVSRGASDLLLAAGTVPVYRVQGELQPARERPPLGAGEVLALLRPVAPERVLSAFEARRDADFGHALAPLGRFRVNLFVDHRGTCAQIRHVPQEVPSLDRLGMPPAVAELCRVARGLVFVTGAAGAGTTTAAAAMIDHVQRTRAAHVLTLEQPIEYVHGGGRGVVNQREVGAHTASFEAGLAAALRESPDVVFVSEVREAAVLRLAVEAAETGALVIATVRAATPVSAIDRVAALLPRDERLALRASLAGVLVGVVSLTLVKKAGGGQAVATEVATGAAAQALAIGS